MRSVLVVALIFVTGLLCKAKSAASSEDGFIPVASFTATTVCQSLPTVFTNNSTTLSGSIVASIWDFGDGEGSSVFNPKHVYTNSGTFSVTLTVINTQGDVDDFTALVTVYPSGVLNFVISSTNQCVSSTFNFSNLSNIVSGSFTSYAWDFGDGTSAATQNASHHYNAFGTYTVKLTVTTNNNCNNTFSKILEVYPEAAVDFNAVNVCMGKEMAFNNITTVGSGLVGYAWNFGDAQTSTEINPKHAYASAGDFQVTLKATTEKGCITTTTKQVTTNPVPVVGFTVADHCFGTSAVFSNQSNISNGTLSYNWNFGDGNTSIVVAPSHLYATTGNFEVTLNATSSAGCENALKKFLYVSPKAVADFSFANICFGEKAEFANNSVAQGEVKYVWDFGDGTTSQSVNPQHSYTVYGQYDVKLIASNPQGGCPDQLIKQIKVNQQPIALFETKDNCLDSLIVFKNTSVYQGTDINYAWQFGDGKSSIESSPSHLYTSSQTYQVTLNATAVNGCSNAYIKQVRVAPLPLVNFMVDNVCDTRNTEFRNFTSISSGTVSYVWDFGDGASSADSDPVHLYSREGDYKVKATATSELGCVGVKEKNISVYPMAIADFSAPAVCDGFPVLYQNKSTVAVGDITGYRWDFGDQTNSIVRNPSKEYIKAATYVVKLAVTTDRGCEASVEKSVTVYPPVVAGFSVKDVCSTEAIRITNTSSVSTGSLTYKWDFGDQSTSVATSPTHQFKDYGVYNIKLVALSVTGCKDSVYHAVAIFNSPEVSAGEDQQVSQGYPVQLNAFGGAEYSWSPIEGLDNSTISSPVATPLVTTEYVVTVKDQYGCENTDTVTVSVENDYKLMAANVLTPDGNGRNDTWVIENVETFGDVHVSIYDRWGKLVYKQNAYQNNWAGMAGGDALPDGTYYYFISFDTSDKLYKGAITLIRNKQ